jgi:hypothetical protein
LKNRKYLIRGAQKVEIGDTLAIIPFIRKDGRTVPDPSILNYFNVMQVTEVQGRQVVGQELFCGKVTARMRKMIFPRLHRHGYTLLMKPSDASALVRQITNYPTAPLRPTTNQHIRMEQVAMMA